MARAAVNQARVHHGRRRVRAESRAAVQVHHGHQAVANRASQVAHRHHGVLAVRAASLEVTLLHQAHLAVTNGPNLHMAVEVGIRRPSLPTPSHHTPNHRTPNHRILSQVTLNHHTHLISPRTTDTMVATEASGAQVVHHRAHGHRVVESRVRAEEDRQAHRAAGDRRARGRVASLVEGTSGIRVAND